MMESNYTYSFIIPHHNSPELLNRCISSIPSRFDIQIIVVDDNSLECRRPDINRTNTEIIFIDKDSSKGAGHARNIGLEKATGEWLLFPDCDDYYDEGFLDVLDSYRKCKLDVVYFCFKHLDGKTGEQLNNIHFEKYWKDYDGSNYMRDQIRFHHNVPWTKMVSRNFILRNNIRFEETINGNDIFFSMQVGYYTNNIAIEKKQLYVYLRNENSILTKKATAKSLYCKIRHRILQNEFYSYIGHPEWCLNSIRFVFICLKQLPIKEQFSLLLLIMKNCKQLYAERKVWTKLKTQI